MEIIGDALPDEGRDGTETGQGNTGPGQGSTGPATERPAGAPAITPAGVEIDLDSGEPRASSSSPPTAKLAAVFSGESLAVAGLTMAVAATVGGYLNPITVIIVTLSVDDSGPRHQVEEFATGLLISGTVALALSIAGLFRLPASGPGWARALAGAGALVAVLCLIIAGVALWKATSLTGTSASVL